MLRAPASCCRCAAAAAAACRPPCMRLAMRRPPNALVCTTLWEVFQAASSAMRAAQAARAPSAVSPSPSLPGQRFRKHVAAPEQHSRCSGAGRRQQATGGSNSGAACRQQRRRTVVAAVSSNSFALLEQPALVLAGFYLEELATVRQLLDQVGGQAIRVVPSTPALLHGPLAEALGQPEPAWDQPAPPDWQHGGGWGQQKMAVMAGLSEEQCQVLLNLLEEVELSPVIPALAAPDNLAAPLGEVLAVALKAWRARPAPGTSRGSSSGGGSAAAPQAAAAAPATAAEAAPAGPAAAATPAAEAAAAAAAPPAEPAVPFVEELPPVEAVVPEEVWQPEEAQQRRSSGGRGRGRDSWRRAGGAAGPEVVPAEFTESVPAQQAAQQAGQAAPAPAGQQQQAGQGKEEAPLDLIDAIAAGVEPSAANAISKEEAEGLAAAAEAMGLGSAQLQQLVDGVAAQAAEAMQVPFVADAGQSGSEAGGSTRAAAAKPSSGTRKPWEAGSAPAASSTAAGNPAAASSGSASGAVGSSRGFGAAAAPGSKAGRKDVRRGARGSGAGLQGRLAELKTAGKAEASPAAAAAAASSAAFGGSSSSTFSTSGSSSNASLQERLAELKAAGKAEPPSPAAAASSAAASAAATTAAASEEARRSTSAPAAEPSVAAGSGSTATADSEASDSARPIPPVDAFVLSKEQLRGVAERHGLDFEEMLRGLEERDIGLAD
ncbi:hypothetical protein ABPG75_008668 [Micractinium tetrahymenae]